MFYFRYIPLTGTISQSMFELKNDYKQTNVLNFLENRKSNQGTEDDLKKIDPTRALRILITPKLKLYNTSLRVWSIFSVADCY